MANTSDGPRGALTGACWHDGSLYFTNTDTISRLRPDGSIEDIRLEMETHYFGTLAVTRAFAPIIERNIAENGSGAFACPRWNGRSPHAQVRPSV